MKKLQILLTVMLLTGCAHPPHPQIVTDADVVPHLNKCLGKLGEPRHGSRRFAKDRFVLRVLYVPTWTPVICYRVEHKGKFGPIIASIRVTNGQGGYDWGSVVFEDQRLVGGTDYYDNVFSPSLVLANAEPHTDLDLTAMDGCGVFVEVCVDGVCSAIVRSEPHEQIDVELRERLRPLAGEDAEWEIDKEVEVRRNLSSLIDWLEAFWGLSRPSALQDGNNARAKISDEPE